MKKVVSFLILFSEGWLSFAFTLIHSHLCPFKVERNEADTVHSRSDVFPFSQPLSGMDVFESVCSQEWPSIFHNCTSTASSFSCCVAHRLADRMCISKENIIWNHLSAPQHSSQFNRLNLFWKAEIKDLRKILLRWREGFYNIKASVVKEGQEEVCTPITQIKKLELQNQELKSL